MIPPAPFEKTYPMNRCQPTLRRILRNALIASVFIGTAPAVWAQDRVLPSEQELIAVLQSADSEPAKKAMACKHLAIQGTSAAVPALAKLLDNEQLASWARIALEAIPGTIADEALRKSTEGLSGRLLVGAINTIGVRRDASAVEVLKRQLSNSDGEVASAAAVALGRIGDAAATETLMSALAGAPVPVRTSIAEGLVLCAERLQSEGNSARAVQVYDEIRKSAVSKQRIVEATRGAILARKQDGIGLLVEHLRSSDKALFQVALGTAREFPGSEVDRSLATELEKATAERAALIIAAMADRKASGNLAAIQKSAGSGAKPVRLAAIGALGRVGNASSVPTLIAAASQSDEELSQAAKDALAQLPDDSASQEILSSLAKADNQLLAVLIDVVGRRRISATKELVNALGSSDKTVRAAALTSLGATVSQDALGVLIAQVVSPKNPSEATVAQAALKTAAIRMPDREACAKELTSAMDKSSVETKIAILEMLAAVGGTQALQTVSSAAKSSDASLKDAGSRLLGDWMTIDAAPILLELAKSGPLDKYQVRELRGYIRIARQFNMREPERVAMCQNAWDACKQTAERKLVLEILKRYPNIEMLKIAIKASSAADVKKDAADAAREIAKKLANNPAAQDLLSKAGL